MYHIGNGSQGVSKMFSAIVEISRHAIQGFIFLKNIQTFLRIISIKQKVFCLLMFGKIYTIVLLVIKAVPLTIFPRCRGLFLVIKCLKFKNLANGIANEYTVNSQIQPAVLLKFATF